MTTLDPTRDPRQLPGDTARARKAEILRFAQDAVEHRGQRRRARRHAVAMIALMAAATVLAVTLTPSRTAGPGASPRPIASGGPIASSAGPAVVRMATTAGIASTLTADTGPVTITRVPATAPAATITRVATTSAVDRVGDAEALALLGEAGTPAGLVRIGGQTTLVYHEAPTTTPGPSSDAGDGLIGGPLRRLLAMAATYRPG